MDFCDFEILEIKIYLMVRPNGIGHIGEGLSLSLENYILFKNALVAEGRQ